MNENLTEIRKLLQEKADYQARLKLLPYDGSPEIKSNKSGKYLYIRKRIGSKLTSTYVNVYSDELYETLLRNQKEARDLKKLIRSVDKKLSSLGYEKNEISFSIRNNLDFARANMKTNIYDQAILEGVATSFPQTEDIIENGTVSGMTANDIQKILNLKHSWEFIMDDDVIQAESDYYLLCHIAKIVNEGFFSDGGRIRGIPVTIGGCSYIPPLPIESVVKEEVQKIIHAQSEAIDKGIEVCLYCMRTQIFVDGNKRAAVIFANHYLIAHGQGLLIIPEKEVPKFKKLLVTYYETGNIKEIKEFLKKKCWRKI